MPNIPYQSSQPPAGLLDPAACTSRPCLVIIIMTLPGPRVMMAVWSRWRGTRAASTTALTPSASMTNTSSRRAGPRGCVMMSSHTHRLSSGPASRFPASCASPLVSCCSADALTMALLLLLLLLLPSSGQLQHGRHALADPPRPPLPHRRRLLDAPWSLRQRRWSRGRGMLLERRRLLTWQTTSG